MFGEVQEFADFCWKEVLSLVKNAAVYIDHAAAECLHWHTGDRAYLTLKDAGALSVHELALYNFHNLKAEGVKNAVIISTSTDTLFYQRTLKLIIEKNDFEKCFVICTAHRKILNYTSFQINEGERESSYDTLKGDILHWMNDKTLTKNSQVTMIFKPIFIACLKKNVFVTPPFGNLIQSPDGELTEDLQADIEFLISSFHTLFSHYDVQEDIYSLGKLSNYVADKLENLTAAINRRKQVTNKKKVSLILVDRMLDLSTATTHNSESILGRILCTLPHLPHHNNDVAVFMHSLSLKGEHECSSSFMVPGCLANTNEEIMDLLFNKKQKEILLTSNKMLIDMTANKESPKTSRISTRITAHSLEKGIQKFRDSESIDSLCKNSKNLQIIAAVVQSLKSNKTAQIDFLISLEKLILQNLAVSKDSSSILSQLSNIVKTRATRGLDMENLLVLLIYLYAMAGPDIKFSQQQEQALKEALSSAIFDDIKKCNETDSNTELSAYYQTLLLLGVTDDEETRSASIKITEKIMDVLHKILGQRGSLKNYRQIMSMPNPREMARHIGILEQLITDLLDQNRLEIPDLVQKNSLLSSGLSYLKKGKSNNHPCDNDWIIVYVLGGITPDEVKTLEEIIKTRNPNGPKITLGGSRLLNPLEVVDRILLTNISTL